MIEDAIFLLKKMKKDAEFLTFTAYGSEKSYSIYFPHAYIVVYKNESKIQMRFINLGNFRFSKEDLKDNDVKVFWDQDQLVLEVETPKKFLKTFSSVAEGTFYLRNKGVGFILTNKEGQFLDLNYTIKPVEPYLSWGYNITFNYSNPWEDIWVYVFYNNKKVGEIYFFENLTSIFLNFSRGESNYYPLFFKIETDFGNYWEKTINFEVPYNSKVNITFSFNKNDQINYFNVTFNYLGKNWSVYLNNSRCGENTSLSKNLSYPLSYVKYSFVSDNNNCYIRIVNAPTYTNYSISYSINGKSGKTWRIITPYIKACDSDSCNTSYWNTTIRGYINSFILVNKSVNTTFSNGECVVNNEINEIYYWNGSEVKINLN